MIKDTKYNFKIELYFACSTTINKNKYVFTICNRFLLINGERKTGHSGRSTWR